MKPSEELKHNLVSILRDGAAHKEPDLQEALRSPDGSYCGCTVNEIVVALRKDGHKIDCFRWSWAMYGYRLLGVAAARIWK